MIKNIFYFTVVYLSTVINIAEVSAFDIEYEFETEETIYVVGDVHGAFNEIQATLKTLKLINQENNWIGGKSHFVSLGDLMDRGPDSRKVFELYMKLQKQAEAAGGKFHVVLGNHEVMNLTGDLRYLSDKEIAAFALDETAELRQEKYQYYLATESLKDTAESKQKFEQRFAKGYFAHQQAFSLSGKYGQWLLSLPFVIQINDQLFAHGGLSSSAYQFSLSQFNQSLKQSLVDYMTSWNQLNQTEKPSLNLSYHQRYSFIKNKIKNKSEQADLFLTASQQLLFSLDGPTWYRGNAICHPYYEQDSLDLVLKKWRAKRLWVGHTTTPNREVLQRLDGKLIIIDTGMLNSHYKGTPYAGVISNDEQLSFINGLTGQQVQAQFAPVSEQENPYAMTDQALELFLQTAKVVKIEDIAEGKTKPVKVSLEQDGRKISAIFKFKDTSPKLTKGGWSDDKEKSDRYQHEVAAYKLDRMLGLGLVPVTVERKINGKKGILQLWINDLISDLKMNSEQIAYRGYCNPYHQVNLMDSFDYLILNRDRNQSNIMYRQSDWQLVFIDHSRSFGTSTRVPKVSRKSKFYPTPEFKKALQKLTFEQLTSLKPWLHNKQIRSVWKRRKKMLKM
jgi:hypothetical protein